MASVSAGIPSPGKNLKISGLTQRYGAVTAIANIDLDIAGGELVSLLGPSGCGKTTLLRAIAGFVRQTEGNIAIGGGIVDDLPPNRRAVGIVFQNYALFPHMSVADNIGYGLDVRRLGRAEKAARTREMLALVKMETFAGRYPRELSGGQQQRIAIARALAVRPSILLLDEPFSALDKNLRLDMQIEVKRIQRLAGITTILVTHDQEEALSMSDRVAVLSSGTLEQFAPPTEIYDAPSSLFVNTFVGSANVLTGAVVGEDAEEIVVRLDAGATVRGRRPPKPIEAGARVSVCLRPENMAFAADDPEGLPAFIEMGLPLGATIVHEVRTVDGASLKVSTPRSENLQPLPPGTPIRLKPTTRANVFPAA
jgi:putative spermidine/putrescine transport system ATP-binding protein